MGIVSPPVESVVLLASFDYCKHVGQHLQRYRTVFIAAVYTVKPCTHWAIEETCFFFALMTSHPGKRENLTGEEIDVRVVSSAFDGGKRPDKFPSLDFI